MIVMDNIVPDHFRELRAQSHHQLMKWFAWDCEDGHHWMGVIDFNVKIRVYDKER